ncbi:MAG: BrnT family toxin [Methylococcales bacterium]|nr:BrnT family toxin [Methylococcales bacterium]
MKIEYDPRKATTNFRKHGVSFEEAQSCLLDPHALVFEDPDATGEVRFVLVGLSSRLRLLTLIYALPDEQVVRLISARLSTTKEVKNYA